MTRQEIEKKIDEIETREFYLQMKDRWDRHDFELSRKHDEEVRKLKEMLKELD